MNREGQEKNSGEKQQKGKSHSHCNSSSPSRAGVEGCPVWMHGCIHPGLRLRRSPGLAALHCGAAFPSCSEIFEELEQNSGTRPTLTALQSRGGDGISPSSRARSLWLMSTTGSNGLNFQTVRSRRRNSARSSRYKLKTTPVHHQFAGGAASGTSFPALRISMCKIFTGKSGRLFRGSTDIRAIFFTNSTESRSHWPKIV
jgi:hypothetical protein